MEEEKNLNNDQAISEKVMEAIKKNIQQNKELSDNVNKIIYSEVKEEINKKIEEVENNESTN